MSVTRSNRSSIPDRLARAAAGTGSPRPRRPGQLGHRWPPARPRRVACRPRCTRPGRAGRPDRIDRAAGEDQGDARRRSLHCRITLEGPVQAMSFCDGVIGARPREFSAAPYPSASRRTPGAASGRRTRGPRQVRPDASAVSGSWFSSAATMARCSTRTWSTRSGLAKGRVVKRRTNSRRSRPSAPACRFRRPRRSHRGSPLGHDDLLAPAGGDRLSMSRRSPAGGPARTA